jgi:hypothetical protein
MPSHHKAASVRALIKAQANDPNSRMVPAVTSKSVGETLAKAGRDHPHPQPKESRVYDTEPNNRHNSIFL